MNLASIQAAALSQQPLKPSEPTCRLPRPPRALTQSTHLPCTRRPRTGSYACAEACTGHRARSRPRMGTEKCAAAPLPWRSGTAQSCAHNGGHLRPSSSRPGPAPPRATHRGPAPHRERRVRNQVPVCGNGIRSLATREVALTERRKPARDSEGRKEESVRGRRGQDLKNPYLPAPTSQSPQPILPAEHPPP